MKPSLFNLLRLIKRPRYASRLFRAHRVLSRFPQPYRLNLGCGKVRFPDWINIDLSTSDSAADLAWDLRDPLPVGDNSCEYIYTEHVLEHFTVEHGLALMRECRRALQPGGVVRIAMPSLDVLVEKSANGHWRDQDWLHWPQFAHIQTRAEMMNIAFRSWGHLWLYDREEFHRRLKEAGFTTFTDAEWGRSSHTALSQRETRQDSLLICEATKDA